jgi:hypothetical protein
MYADHTEIYASAKAGDELVTNINSDLENVRKWMLQNKLQIHPTKTKHVHVGSFLLPGAPCAQASIGFGTRCGCQMIATK